MSTTEIVKDIQSLAPSALIELFVLDYTMLPYPGVLRFHAGSNEVQSDIVWQGQSYMRLPIEASGFDLETKGALPRPHVKVANTDGIFSAEVAANRDLVGAKLIRKRTFAKYLDAANFASGTNPTANPDQHYPDETWWVDQKIDENRFLIEWELASPFDLAGVMLPARQVIQNSCGWEYPTECGYDRAGGLFDALDNPVSTIAEDVCGKRLNSCKCRKAGFSEGILPFGGFPGANRFE